MNIRNTLLSALLVLSIHQAVLSIEDPRASILVHKDFDPNNINHCRQLFVLFAKNHEYLFNPDEKPVDMLWKYREAALGKSVKFYDGLCIKFITTLTSDPEDEVVVGFVAYQLQGTHPNLPLFVRTIAIDPEYQRLGLAQALLSKCEQEARDIGKKSSICAVYSHNVSMQHVTKKQGYCCVKKDPRAAFIRIEDDLRTLVHTHVFFKQLQPERVPGSSKK